MSPLIKYTVAILFILFGLVQYNDPDWYLWMPIYFFVAAAYLYDHKLFPTLIKFSLLLLTLFLISYIPSIQQWVHDGRPNIAASMKAESPSIELLRELLGLALCIIFLAYKLYRK